MGTCMYISETVQQIMDEKKNYEQMIHSDGREVSTYIDILVASMCVRRSSSCSWITFFFFLNNFCFWKAKKTYTNWIWSTKPFPLIEMLLINNLLKESGKKSRFMIDSTGQWLVIKIASFCNKLMMEVVHRQSLDSRCVPLRRLALFQLMLLLPDVSR